MSGQPYVTLLSALLLVQPLFVCYTYLITKSDYTYGCATLIAAFLCKHYIRNHWMTMVCKLNGSLSL